MTTVEQREATEWGEEEMQRAKVLGQTTHCSQCGADTPDICCVCGTCPCGSTDLDGSGYVCPGCKIDIALAEEITPAHARATGAEEEAHPDDEEWPL